MEQSETNNLDEEFIKKIEKDTIPENDFLEKSLISEIKQTINRLEEKWANLWLRIDADNFLMQEY